MSTDEQAGDRSDGWAAEGRPVVHRDLDVRVGTLAELTTLDRELLDHWVDRIRLSHGNEFMVVARQGEGEFIQCYRNAAGDFDVEWDEGLKPPRYRAATARDESEVADLLWAWLEGDVATLDRHEWGPLQAY